MPQALKSCPKWNKSPNLVIRPTRDVSSVLNYYLKSAAFISFHSIHNFANSFEAKTHETFSAKRFPVSFELLFKFNICTDKQERKRERDVVSVVGR